ncbi:MAG: gliding motility-associated C-terminal domain-containing protein [Bacteroidota bacterium]
MKTLLIILFWVFFAHALFAQAFQCNDRFYLIGQSAAGSFLEANYWDENGTLRAEEITLSEPDRQYTCLGMSIQDMHLYALDFNTKELLRINADGQVDNLGVPEALRTDLEYWAGYVAPEGRRLVVVGYDKTEGRDKEIYSINLVREGNYAGVTQVVSTLPTQITDISLDPVYGTLYGYDKRNKQIVSIGTNSITHHQHRKVGELVEGLFFDEFGQLYAYGGGEIEQSTLYKINKFNGEFETIASVTRGQFSDACSCAFRMRFERTVTPHYIVPCEPFTIEYTIFNSAGEGKTGGFLEDILPESIVITEVVDHTFTLATIESGVSSSVFSIPNLDILIGENTITLKAELVADAAATLSTQATLENLALGLGGYLLSDNPGTQAPEDPNINQLTQNESFDLQNHIAFDCSGEQAQLSLPITPTGVIWSTGEQTPSIAVSEIGWYWVEAKNECITLRDSIYIDSFPEALELNLGEDLIVQQGKPFQLAFQTNVDSLTTIKWSSQNEFELDCTDCWQPSLLPLRDNTYFLAITNAAGCTVQDSIRIQVEGQQSIYAATAFSPDGDGINDAFYLQGIEGASLIRSFQVFDRWGSVLHDVRDANPNDINTAWLGENAVNGSYVWVAEISWLEGKSEVLKGVVDLVRE